MLAVNSLPWSVTNSAGIPKRQIQLLNSASVTVVASLFGIATNSTYFVNASVITKINFLPFSEVFSGLAVVLWVFRPFYSFDICDNCRSLV